MPFEYEVAETTGIQTISYLFAQDTIERSTAEFGTYAAYRALRKDSTIALGRGLLVSGVKAGSWAVEADEEAPEEVVAFVKTLLPLREDIMGLAVGYGRVDYGWMGFEKIFVVKDGRLTLRLKPLLHDMTTILIDNHGNFAGYRQSNSLTALPIDVPAEYSLHIAFDVEGANLYGSPLLENVRAIQQSWLDCDAGAKRYDKKIAGSHWIVHYPPGTSQIDDETVQNADVAKQILTALESSGSMSLPSTTAEFVQELNDKAVAALYSWDVKLITAEGTGQGSFVERLKYLDSLKIRGLVLPERSMLEGSYGTKADAGEHIGLAVTGMQNVDQHITRQVNKQVVNQLLALNFGLDMVGKVRLVASPLVDRQIAFLRDLYLKVLTAVDMGSIDLEALKEQLNIPAKQEEPA